MIWPLFTALFGWIFAWIINKTIYSKSNPSRAIYWCWMIGTFIVSLVPLFVLTGLIYQSTNFGILFVPFIIVFYSSLKKPNAKAHGDTSSSILSSEPKVADGYHVNSPKTMPSPASVPTSTFNQFQIPSQPIQGNSVANVVATNPVPDDLWAQALIEYDSGSRNQGLWARLFSEAQGNEAVVKANYMRIRVDEMQQVIAIEKAKQSVGISHEQIETIDNSIAEKKVDVKNNSNFWVSLPFLIMKWLPWLGAALAILGILFFLGRNTTGTNQSARAEIPLLNPALPTASVQILNQALSLDARSEEVQRQAQAAAKATTIEIPKFINYPVQIYSGTYAKVELTKQDSAFKTRLRDSFQSPINFAGEYTLTLWGCGMDCVMGAAVSKRTGIVVWLPGTVCCWKGSGTNIEYRSNSKLIVLGGLINEEGKHAAHFYELKNDVFVPILSTPADGQLSVPEGEFNITMKVPPNPNDPNSPENYFSQDNLSRRNLAERSAYYHKWMKAHANTYLTDMGKKQYEQEFRRKGPDNLFGIVE